MEINSTGPSQFPVQDPLQTSQDKGDNQKGNILVIIGVIVLLLIVGGGAYYYFGKSQATKSQPQSSIIPSQIPQVTPIQSPAQTTDETANWKTYTITPLHHYTRFIFGV